MKIYDFETIQPRYATNTTKWKELEEYFPEGAGDIVPFSVADMELSVAPEIKEGLKQYIDKYVLGYNNATSEYYEAVCNWMEHRHNWKIKKDWILTSVGVIHAFFSAVKAYANSGDGVILCTPVYYPMYTAITTHGCKIAECPLINSGNGYSINFDLLEKLAQDPKNKLLLFCNPHNPGGRVWTKEELIKINEICIKNNVIITSDDIHFDLIMPNYTHTVIASLSDEAANNAVILTAPSKSFNLAGMLTANVIIPNSKLRERYLAEQKKDTQFPKCGALGYEACRIAYSECGDWLDQVNQLVYKNSQIVIDYLKKYFPEIIVMDLEGSYLLWMDFSPLGIECHHLANVLRKEGKLFFDDGYIFGKAGDGFERWNLACPTRYIKEALPRLREVLNNHRTK